MHTNAEQLHTLLFAFEINFMKKQFNLLATVAKNERSLHILKRSLLLIRVLKHGFKWICLLLTDSLQLLS